MISHQPGLLPQSTGRPTHERFWGSVLFCDHFSDLIYNHLITGTTSEQTLGSKHAYERFANEFGVKIRSYRADNMRFNDNNFRGSCVTAGQKLTFCAVGTHHQNGLAEAKIKQICYGARTVLLHAMHKWPKVITTALWPFAMQAVVDRHNCFSLDKDGRSPIEKFSGVQDDINTSDFHTFGYPTFILNAANQSGYGGTPKWEPRSHTGIYIGRSPSHSSSVALVMNLATGLTSPQYHVIYDDEFSTVPYLTSDDPPLWSSYCSTLCNA